MKTVQYTWTALLCAGLMLAIAGCGGSDSSFEAGDDKTAIDIECDGNDIADYIDLKSGDTIVKEDDNTVISTYHNDEGSKKVCLQSGSAHIVR